GRHRQLDRLRAGARGSARAAHRPGRARRGRGQLRQCRPHRHGAPGTPALTRTAVRFLAPPHGLRWSAAHPGAPPAGVRAMGLALCARRLPAPRPHAVSRAVRATRGRCTGRPAARRGSSRTAAPPGALRTVAAPRCRAPPELLAAARAAARVDEIAGLWFPRCAHVVDPLEVVRAFASAAAEHGASIARRHVRALVPRGSSIEVASGSDSIVVDRVVVCAGAWSAALLTPFGARVPLQSARGYHVEMPGAQPLIDAPVLYQDQSTFVTPMAGRLRSTSFMEFEHSDAPPDPERPAQLRRTLIALGYPADS